MNLLVNYDLIYLMGRLNIKGLLINGFLIWLVPFLVSMFIYPLRETNRALFESIMPVALTFTTVLASVRYFPSTIHFRGEGLLVGAIWVGMSILIDSVMFIFGPIKMSPMDYFQDIALTYLIIPAITFGYADNFLGKFNKETEK